MLHCCLCYYFIIVVDSNSIYLSVYPPLFILLTVEHILISCVDFDIIHQHLYTAANLKDFFHNMCPK